MAAAAAVLLFLSFRPQRKDSIDQFMQNEHIEAAVVAIGSPSRMRPHITAYGTSPQTTFRLVSLSKPITAAAVLKLVRTGRLSLEDRIAGATVLQLLQHSGGWDRDMAGDPLTSSSTRPPSQTCLAVARQAKRFSPGTRSSYSNIGYCLLGLVIEQSSHRSYEHYVQEAVLKSVSAHLSLGTEPAAHYAKSWPNDAYVRLGGAGAWVGTAEDYYRFAAGPIDPSVKLRPAYARAGEHYYGLGWRVWPDGTLSHYGALPGIYNVVFRTNKVVAVALFVGRPRNDEAALVRLKRILVGQ